MQVVLFHAHSHHDIIHISLTNANIDKGFKIKGGYPETTKSFVHQRSSKHSLILPDLSQGHPWWNATVKYQSFISSSHYSRHLFCRSQQVVTPVSLPSEVHHRPGGRRESCAVTAGTHVLLNGSDHQSSSGLTLSGSEWLIRGKMRLKGIRLWTPPLHVERRCER